MENNKQVSVEISEADALKYGLESKNETLQLETLKYLLLDIKACEGRGPVYFLVQDLIYYPLFFQAAEALELDFSWISNEIFCRVDEATPEHQVFSAKFIGKTDEPDLRDKYLGKIDTDIFNEEACRALFRSSPKDIRCLWKAEQMLGEEIFWHNQEVISSGETSFFTDIAEKNPEHLSVLVGYLLDVAGKRFSYKLTLSLLINLWGAFPKENICRDAVLFRLQKEKNLGAIEGYWNTLQELFGPKDFYTFLANKVGFSPLPLEFSENRFDLTSETLVPLTRLLRDDIKVKDGSEPLSLSLGDSLKDLKESLQISEQALPEACLVGSEFPNYPQELKDFVVELVAYSMRNNCHSVASIWLDVIALKHFKAFCLKELKWKMLLYPLEKREVVFNDELFYFHKENLPGGEVCKCFLPHLKKMFQMIDVTLVDALDAYELEDLVCSYGWTLSDIWEDTDDAFYNKVLAGGNILANNEKRQAAEAALKKLLGIE